MKFRKLICLLVAFTEFSLGAGSRHRYRHRWEFKLVYMLATICGHVVEH